MNRPIRVLLVEDNPGDADLIREMLPCSGDSGFTIQCVSRMADAVPHLSRKETDLALLDLDLPDSKGIDTVHSARRAAPRTPIVVLTSHDDERVGNAAVQSGAQDYLIKGQIPGHHLSRVMRYAVHRQRAEDRVRKSERFLRSILDALSGHIAIIDVEGKILATNKGWSEFASSNETVAMRCNQTRNYFDACREVMASDADEQEDAAMFAAGVQAVLSGERDVFEMEYPLTNAQGEYWFHGRVTPFPDKGERRVVVTHEDITARKRAEEEKIQLAAQLRHAYRMEAIGTLAGGIAHDFNNILSSVLGFTELTLLEAEDESSLKYNLQEIYQAGLRAKELVQQILTFARKDERPIQPTQVSIIAKEASKLIRSTIPSSVDIELELDSEAFVLAEPAQLHQIFMNLFTNAAHAMEADGGKLSISLSETWLDRSFDSMHADFKPGNYLRIRVEDTGFGIPEDILHKIYDPYFTTKSRAEGTGLGLSVVHGIIKRYGGEIAVKSRVGKGSVFNVYLPLAPKKTERPPCKSLPLPMGKEHILFIDDELPLAEMNKQRLKLLGYEVTVMSSSIKAIEHLSQQANLFDLVITDMTMPRMSGDQLAMEARKIRPDIPIILCTGYSKKISPAKAEALGINAFLMKPVGVRDLAKTIRRVLDGEDCQG